MGRNCFSAFLGSILPRRIQKTRHFPQERRVSGGCYAMHWITLTRRSRRHFRDRHRGNRFAGEHFLALHGGGHDREITVDNLSIHHLPIDDLPIDNLPVHHAAGQPAMRHGAVAARVTRRLAVVNGLRGKPAEPAAAALASRECGQRRRNRENHQYRSKIHHRTSLVVRWKLFALGVEFVGQANLGCSRDMCKFFNMILFSHVEVARGDVLMMNFFHIRLCELWHPSGTGATFLESGTAKSACA